MKIAVCVKQVPDAAVHKKIDPATKRLDRSGEAALNPTDLNAVEEALRIKESQGAGEVVLVRASRIGVYQARFGVVPGSVSGGQEYVVRTRSAGPSAPMRAAMSATNARP